MAFLKKKGGISILGTLVLAVIFVLVLNYFNIDIKSVIESPASQENVNYVLGNTKTIWDKYLKEPISYLWHDIFLEIFLDPFIEKVQNRAYLP